MSSTCFEHPSFHTQEDLHMQFYGISFMHLPEDEHLDARNMSRHYN